MESGVLPEPLPQRLYHYSVRAHRIFLIKVSDVVNTEDEKLHLGQFK